MDSGEARPHQSPKLEVLEMVRIGTSGQFKAQWVQNFYWPQSKEVRIHTACLQAAWCTNDPLNVPPGT